MRNFRLDLGRYPRFESNILRIGQNTYSKRRFFASFGRISYSNVLLEKFMVSYGFVVNELKNTWDFIFLKASAINPYTFSGHLPATKYYVIFRPT